MQSKSVLPDFRSYGYDLKKLLGDGAYGRVFEAVKITTGSRVAIKLIQFEPVKGQMNGLSSTCMRELTCLKDLRYSDNIVQMHETFMLVKSQTVAIVMELLPNDLSDYLKNFKFGLNNNEVKMIMFQICRGLSSMHRLNYVHRDIKLANILIDPVDMIVKIADFGLSRQSDAPYVDLTNEIETPHYRPLEVAMGSQEYTSSIDVWTLGIVFHELLTGKKPFDEVVIRTCPDITLVFHLLKTFGTPTMREYPNFFSLKHYSPSFPRFKQVPLPKIFPNIKDEALDLLGQMLVLNPANRITPMDALKHPYFEGVPELLKSKKNSNNTYTRINEPTKCKNYSNTKFGNL